jgi:hypothetical protein
MSIARVKKRIDFAASPARHFSPASSSSTPALEKNFCVRILQLLGEAGDRLTRLVLVCRFRRLPPGQHRYGKQTEYLWRRTNLLLLFHSTLALLVECS